jgi:hypothetical protein
VFPVRVAAASAGCEASEKTRRRSRVFLLVVAATSEIILACCR